MLLAVLEPASNRADLDVDVQLVDDAGDPIDLTGVALDVQMNYQFASGFADYGRVSGQSTMRALLASTEGGGNGTVTIATPATSGIFNIFFPAAAMQSIEPGNFNVGARASRDGLVAQLAIGTISVYDGVVTTP